MRAYLLALAVIASLGATTALAGDAAAVFKSSETDIGTLLDDPAARAILDKYMPGFSTGDQIDLARPMTLTSIQPYASDMITDEALKKIDADLAKLPQMK